jgi:hypothetical protein
LQENPIQRATRLEKDKLRKREARRKAAETTSSATTVFEQLSIRIHAYLSQADKRFHIATDNHK